MKGSTEVVMPALSQWADQIESRFKAAPEVVVVGPRPMGNRKVFLSGLVGAAALLVWAANPALKAPPAAPLPAISVMAPNLSAATALHFQPIQSPLVVAPIPNIQGVSQDPMASPEVATPRIARQLLAEKGGLSSFMALAVTVETYAPAPYWDTGGLNIGMGYCITRRVKEQGLPRVRRDLLVAGLAPSDITTLLGHDRQAQKKVMINENQAVALLRQIAPDYEERARSFVGAPTFDALPSHRQAALTWLAYNTGPNIDQFNRLRTAVQGNHPDQALSHLTPTYRDSSGHLVSNHRAGAYLAAAYWSESGLRTAVSNQDRFDSLVARNPDPARLGHAAETAATPLSRPKTLGEAVGSKTAIPMHAHSSHQDRRSHRTP